MDLTPVPEQQLGRFHVAIDAEAYPYAPTLLDVDVSWAADRVLSPPEPSRLVASMWVPDACPVARPELGDRAVIRFTDGISEGSVFAGYVDGVTRRRRRGKSDPTPAVPLPHDLGRPQLPPSVMWSQHGVDKAINWVTNDDPVGVWTFHMPPDTGDGLIDPGGGVGTLDLAEHVPAGSWVWATSALEDDYAVAVAPPPGVTPEPAPGPRAHGRAWWRVDGVLVPLSAGPLELVTVPADLALVVWVPYGADPDLAVSVPLVRPLSAPRRGLPAGEWVDVTATDAIGIYSRHRVGAEPWPQETALARVGRIRTAAQALGLPPPFLRSAPSGQLATDLAAVTVPARDVDRKPPVELLAEVLATVGAVPIATDNGITAYRPSFEHPRELDPDGTVAPSGVILPPTAVADQPIATSTAELTNVIAVTYTDPTDPDDPAERSFVLRDAESVARWGESSARWETPALATPGAVETDLAALLTRLRAALAVTREPGLTFDGPVVLTPVLLARVPPYVGDSVGFRNTVLLGTRHGQTVYIGHDLDDVPTLFAERGGSLIVEDGRVSVALDLEPAGRTGVPAITYADLDASTSRVVTYSTIDPAVTWAEFRTIGL